MKKIKKERFVEGAVKIFNAALLRELPDEATHGDFMGKTYHILLRQLWQIKGDNDETTISER